jgi:hypothetical protein
MKTLILATLVAVSALGSAANAGLMIDATQGPIMITVDGGR